MSEESGLSGSACVFLICLGLLFDGLKIGLDALFGIGLILDPFFITPIATLLFAIVLWHNNISMFSGKKSWAGWTNLVFSFVPVLDFLPDWTVYAIYLTVVHRKRGIIN